MDGFLIGAVAGFVVAVVVVLFLKKRGKRGLRGADVRVYASIEDLRSVGELVAFKMITKEIVTAAEHWFGEFGKRYLTWLLSNKKMAMIFEFEIDFRYDLRSNDFVIEQTGERQYRLGMPKCFYQTHIRDVSFYDEQSSKLLPWLIPDLLSRAFGPGFSETDKNRLKEEAKQQASRMAKDFVDKMRSEVQSSAKQTMETLGKAFGADSVSVDFSGSELVQTKIEASM
jgi:gas vesicle protein